ncbi:glutathione S-transferase N-terminal domain-containing protein [Paracoccus sp. Z118]|uniref:glutathione S-transferase family protein n=1 Tax=Paracoccus sp. Z118 TaxID=2851017 RepID=UPI001C2CBBA9|nr:glutathione S-transferase family protein [Paracoccus sp. Z118]MBV0891871.1 glutathione S-transferase N-terminal domain-containing protein [Paracoccus sp. Z118]
MLTITTYDWVPDMPRGYVRDLRARWACEEAGLDYRIDTVPLHPKSPGHFAVQPFGQVPILRDGELTLFESGAIVLHLAERSPALMPAGARPEVTQWVIAALNSVETWIFPWLLAKFFEKDEAAAQKASRMMNLRLGQLNEVLAGREWLAAGRFTAADIIMADVLRLLADAEALADCPALAAYVERATARPAFRKAHADQIAHFAASKPPPGMASAEAPPRDADRREAAADGRPPESPPDHAARRYPSPSSGSGP